MSWRRMLLRYAWVIAWGELMRSSRWAPEKKARALFLAGVLVSGPTVAAAVWWILMGRGPGRWMSLSEAFVNPFPPQLPADIREGLTRLKNTASAPTRASGH